MPSLPNPYFIAGTLLAIGLAAIGGYFHGTSTERDAWVAKHEAAKADWTAKARAKDAENARLASAIDQANMEKRDALDKAADTARDLARTRGLWIKARGHQCVSATPATSGSLEGQPALIRLHEETASDLIALARDADRAALYAQTCHQWARGVGR